mmetsp:Transcript_74814/g.226687  ORF Transcript_74814/g.226687 Transcript_74814/m.226687 type:complete len:142 (-) Transcript_74814:787-1212(-)
MPRELLPCFLKPCTVATVKPPRHACWHCCVMEWHWLPLAVPACCVASGGKQGRGRAVPCLRPVARFAGRELPAGSPARAGREASGLEAGSPSGHEEAAEAEVGAIAQGLQAAEGLLPLGAEADHFGLLALVLPLQAKQLLD